MNHKQKIEDYKPIFSGIKWVKLRLKKPDSKVRIAVPCYLLRVP